MVLKDKRKKNKEDERRELYDWKKPN